MAQKVTVELVDDLDGGPIADGEGGTVTFSLQHKAFEIDLTSSNIEKLEAALAPFISAARPNSTSPSKDSLGSRRNKGGRDLAAVRTWARNNWHAVSDRGRVPYQG